MKHQLPSEEENDEVKKARFYYEAVVKADEISTRSYERINSKISLFIGVLSAVIPLLTGLGYVVLSSSIVVPFFIFYVICLVFLIFALATCVHLLSPKYFICVDFGDFMVTYDEKSLDFIIFKISHTWEYAIKENINRILSLGSALQRTVRLIIIGLLALVFSFTLLGIDYYLVDFLKGSDFYQTIISESDFQLLLLFISLGIFVILTVLIVKCTSIKELEARSLVKT
ncbi:MAG: hypothetical protein JSV12_00105 [Candidatus Bathyarchaeota archaeon]|nr:MAG: hypothetical protein JSV12_00105 [Candidatus Bathyarchaeota archaeon]